MQELIDLDPNQKKSALKLEDEVKTLRAFFSGLYQDKALLNYLLLVCYLSRIRVDEGAVVDIVEPMITSYKEKNAAHFNKKYEEEFKLRGFCGDRILMLPDFSKETGEFYWDKFEKPHKKKKEETIDDINQEI